MAALFGKKTEVEPVAKAPETANIPENDFKAFYDEIKERKKMLNYLSMQMSMEEQNIDSQLKSLAKSNSLVAMKAYARGIVRAQMTIAKLQENIGSLDALEEEMKSHEINLRVTKELSSLGVAMKDCLAEINDKKMKEDISNFIKSSDKLNSLTELEEEALDGLADNVTEEDEDEIIEQEMSKVLAEYHIEAIPAEEKRVAESVANDQEVMDALSRM